MEDVGCARPPFALHTHQFDVRASRGDSHGHAGEESSTAHWHENGVELWRVLEHLDRDSPLASDHGGIVVRGDEREASLRFKL